MANVVLFEDDIPSSRVYEAVLSKAGHSVTVAANGSMILKSRLDPDIELIITDIVMDEVDGIETVIEVQGQYPNIPIIAISGTRLYLDTVTQLSNAKTLLKPFGGSELLAAVNEALECG
jgi:DNA-binding response OmpR family regulator